MRVRTTPVSVIVVVAEGVFVFVATAASRATRSVLIQPCLSPPGAATLPASACVRRFLPAAPNPADMHVIV